MTELILALRNAYALGRVNADNENYYAPVTLKELKAATEEIERLREALEFVRTKLGAIASRNNLEGAPDEAVYSKMVVALVLSEDDAREAAEKIDIALTPTEGPLPVKPIEANTAQ